MNDPSIVCKPIQTLEQLEKWNCDELQAEDSVEDRYTVASVPCARRLDRACEAPRVLVCHDMCGGYLEDRFVHGTKTSDCYRFYSWQHIDTFIYFSHNLVTSPPTGWINAAHRHGVTVLGTFITEWKEGAKICGEIFETKEKAHAVADILVRIAVYLRFDGWLINIENKIEEEMIPNVCDFVSYLTRELHAQIPGSKVIWYDSILGTGALDWQNELNEKNSMFFDECDGIFLNYCWKEEHLQHSVHHARKEERDRKHDVYVGIDVFGRSCKGGYDTVEALSLICEHDLSVAVFAPGWVYEVASEDKKDFTQNDYRFWSMLLNHLPSHTHCNLPLVTSFCQGCGDKYYLNGEVVCDEPWYNLNIQELQPLLASLDNDGSQQSLIYTTEDAFRGGGCLKLDFQLQQNQPFYCKLFNMNVKIEQNLYIAYSFKVMNSKTDVYLLIKIRKDSGGETTLVFGVRNLMKEDSGKFVYVDALKKQNILPKVSDRDTDNMWTTRYFKWPLEYIPCHLCSVHVGLVSEEAVDTKTSALLGQIQILREEDYKTDAPTINNLRSMKKDSYEPPTKKSKMIDRFESAYTDIQWDSTNSEIVRYYNILCALDKKRILIGQSLDTKFRVMLSSIQDICKASIKSSDEQTDSKVSLPEGGVEINVQPVLDVGTFEPINSCVKIWLPRFGSE